MIFVLVVCQRVGQVDEEKIVVEVTKQDVTGPRRDTEVQLEISSGALIFRKTKLARVPWRWYLDVFTVICFIHMKYIPPER